MNRDQLMGKYFRLQQALSVAYLAQPWHPERVDRLANDLAAVERQIAAIQPTDERSGGLLPTFAR